MLFEPETDAPAGRIHPDWDPELIANPGRSAGALRWFGSGLLLLLVGWIVLCAIGFVGDQFHRAAGLGIATVAVFGLAALALGVGVCIELAAWRALHAVDDLCAALTAKDCSHTQAKALCLRWLERVTARLPDHPAAVRAIGATITIVELRAVLHHQVLDVLRQTARQAGRRAALEGGAVVAITPSDTLDGMMAGLRGLALVRQIAQLYGVRPGIVVTLALLRRVAWTAAGVSGVELLSQTLADHALRELPIIKRLVGAVPGSGLAAMRLYRLAGMTAEACSPLPTCQTEDEPGHAGGSCDMIPEERAPISTRRYRLVAPARSHRLDADVGSRRLGNPVGDPVGSREPAASEPQPARPTLAHRLRTRLGTSLTQPATACGGRVHRPTDPQ